MNFAGNANVRVRRLQPCPGVNPRRMISVLPRLRDRELYGKDQRSIACKRHLFSSVLPRRFAFPITSVVDDFTLREVGHVFLGFSSCDRFLISYTVRVEATRHTGLPTHIYTLHWWTWNPCEKAKKVGSVELFANEEIENSLYLYYAEWPTLKSQIIVYGWRKGCDSCYFTITAIPSLVPCVACTNLASILLPDSNDEAPVRGGVKCRKHGFAMHFKQALGTSQSGVLNTSGLKIDGVLVLNIGHSIAVISTGLTFKTTNLDNLPLSSIKRSACEDTVIENDMVDVVVEKEQTPMNVPLNPDLLSIITEKKFTSKNVENGISSSSNFEHLHDFLDSQDMHSQSSIPPEKTSIYDDIEGDQHDSCVRISLHRKSMTADKENVTHSPVCEQMEYELSLNVDPYFDPEPKTIVLGRVLKDPTSPPPVQNVKIAKYPGEQSIKCNVFPDKSPAKSAFDFVENCDKICNSPRHCNPMHSIVGETGGERKFLSDIQSVTRNKFPFLSPPSVLNERQNSLEVTRSDLNFVTPSPTASDGSSSVQFSTVSNDFSNSTKYGSAERNSDGLVSFTETFYGTIRQDGISPEEPLPVSEASLHFGSMLCQGAGKEMLHPIERKENSSIQAFSQHLVLDLEHVIFDILRTRCHVAYKFGYLVDYEANIVDVCGAINSVIVHVVALLTVKQHRSKCSLLSDATSANAQQAEFILSWSLSSGRYEVVVARPLVSYDERQSGEWKGDWIFKMDSAIKQQCAIGANPYKSVYILDNSAVLRGRSLNILWNCDKTLALARC